MFVQYLRVSLALVGIIKYFERPGLTRNHETRLEMLARDEQSSLFCLSVSGKEKKFCNFDARCKYYEIFLVIDTPEK